MDLLLVAFAAFFLTEVAKTVIRRYGTVDPVVKLVLVGIVAGAVAAVIIEDTTTAIVTALAGSGVAPVVHKAHRWFSAAGDAHQLATMQMARRPR